MNKNTNKLKKKKLVNFIMDIFRSLALIMEFTSAY